MPPPQVAHREPSTTPSPNRPRGQLAIATAEELLQITGTTGQVEVIRNRLALAQAIHADEFNELIGDEFIPLINKAGGAGYQVTAYTQTWSDVEARVGNAAKAAQIGGNFNTLFMLRVKNKETAEILTNQLPDVPVLSITPDSGTSDAQDPDAFADFSARSTDRITREMVPMLQPSDLTSLPKGQAFALLEGGQLAKLRFPLPTGDDADPAWPSSMEAVFKGMHAQYQRHLSRVVAEPDQVDAQHLDVLTVEGRGHGR